MPSYHLGFSSLVRESRRTVSDRLRTCALAAVQGLTLVHCAAELKRFPWDMGLRGVQEVFQCTAER